jgi:hypothetical protein
LTSGVPAGRGELLVDASGKMMVLERLLDELFARDQKVLVFLQFVTYDHSQQCPLLRRDST